MIQPPRMVLNLYIWPMTKEAGKEVQGSRNETSAIDLLKFN
jgi:hypothetical protein